MAYCFKWVNSFNSDTLDEFGPLFFWLLFYFYFIFIFCCALSHWDVYSWDVAMQWLCLCADWNFVYNKSRVQFPVDLNPEWPFLFFGGAVFSKQLTPPEDSYHILVAGQERYTFYWYVDMVPKVDESLVHGPFAHHSTSRPLSVWQDVPLSPKSSVAAW